MSQPAVLESLAPAFGVGCVRGPGRRRGRPDAHTVRPARGAAVKPLCVTADRLAAQGTMLDAMGVRPEHARKV